MSTYKQEVKPGIVIIVNLPQSEIGYTYPEVYWLHRPDTKPVMLDLTLKHVFRVKHKDWAKLFHMAEETTDLLSHLEGFVKEDFITTLVATIEQEEE